MFYLIQHLWLYLLLAASLGALLMWLLRHRLMKDKVREVHAAWQMRWNGLEREHLQVSKELQDALRKASLVPALETELARLQTNYQTLSDRHVALDADWKRKYDAAEKDWRGKFTAVEKERADLHGQLQASTQEQEMLTANLAECGRKRTSLEEGYQKVQGQIADWSRRFAALEQEANEAKGQIMTLTRERDRLRQETHAATERSRAEGETLRQRVATLEAKCKAAEERLGGDIERIEGIGQAFGQRLRDAGITWVADLLYQCSSSAGRAQVAEKTGCTPEQLLTWTNMADLLRIPGVTPDWAELLHAAGVDTVKELKQRVPENLQRTMTEVNATAAQKITATVPDVTTVSDWVQHANAMEFRVTY
jgi:predicted flap endonuclease-1-like 5' DNA nuclease